MRQQDRCGLPSHVAAALDELKAALSGLYGRRLRGVYLYGSYARGDYRLESDWTFWWPWPGQSSRGLRSPG